MTNRIWIDQVEKVTPVWDDRIVQTDSANSNNTVWSKLSNIATAIFGLKTTTDLEEWTNLYYTDARVSANTTLLSKADKTNVLQLDNTTPYTPTANYHPATKEYVDSWSLPIASTTTQGIIEIATDTEINTWTDTTRAVTPSQINTIIIASNNVIATSLATAALSTWAYAKVKEAVCIKTWTYRINFTLYAYWGVNIWQSYWKIYKNWVAYWTERYLNSYNGSQSYSEDLSFVVWDLIQIYWYLWTNAWISWNINTFQIWAAQFQSIFIPTINL